MLNIKSMAILLKITAKLDIKPVIDKLKNLDIFAEAKSPDEAMKQLTKEKAAIVGAEMFAAILPQLDSVSDFLAEFVAAYKGVSVEEAEKLDAIEVIKELIGDCGVLNFFSSALRKKVERTH
ncbi:hypothetical protein DWW95_04970 [Ruminococcus sp. AF17-6LB]|uniref:hypothetical protein n=1 Tax=unclassified Ruminococcus TaxID=2608920 RepID=UPI000E4BCAAA|nr:MULTISPECIES: hypothetical protein [unclassified Ruminococcus]RGG72151.1 hypothetical protein DWW95_04970 [Ruminococcus sp. AF17-6LB]RGG73891.1 hypothetical protein DWW94_04960 [Ruminococcus sp. AF17-6]RGG80963.1 hypothetical protein DWW81_05440 [Ruminococcus sp. AF17-1AC]